VLKPVLEVLAGVPTVVYGFFALTFVTPIIRSIWPQTDVFNALSASIVVGIMIIPMVSSLSEDAMSAVPRSLREGAYALGATKFEVATRTVVPAALSGIIASFILAISRAIGETMIVTIAAGARPNLTLNPLRSVQTMTAYIAQTAWASCRTAPSSTRPSSPWADALRHHAAHEHHLDRSCCAGSARCTNERAAAPSRRASDGAARIPAAARSRAARAADGPASARRSTCCACCHAGRRRRARRAAGRHRQRRRGPPELGVPERVPVALRRAGRDEAGAGRLALDAGVLTALIAFPLGVGTAIWLEEYAPAAG
jgi:hypothetical protein